MEAALEFLFQGAQVKAPHLGPAIGGIEGFSPGVYASRQGHSDSCQDGGSGHMGPQAPYMVPTKVQKSLSIP